MPIHIKDNCLIMSNEKDLNSIRQIESLLQYDIYAKEKIRIMPDYHSGLGSVIGFTSTFKDIINPFVVGVDIGCGVLVYPLGRINIDFEVFDEEIRRRIPIGFHHRSSSQEKMLYNYLPNLPKFSTHYPNNNNIIKQIGTLGGGNHFIEIDKDDKEIYYVSIHTGSRNFGLKIAQWHQEIAYNLMRDFHIDIKKEHSYLPLNYGGKEYLDDMDVAQNFASINRLIILFEILDTLGIIDDFNPDNIIESVHNYIDLDDKIIRKGAIKCKENQNVVIPLNMKDGVIIGKGKSDKSLFNWNFSAPHGAGRKYSRGNAKKKFSLEDYKNDMKGIFTTSLREDNVDEISMAYKNSSDIISSISEVVKILKIIKPVYSLKD